MLRKAVKLWSEPVWVARVGQVYQKTTDSLKHQVAVGMNTALYQWGLLVAVIGFLLGRAVILTELTPFVLPFLAAIYLLKRDKAAIASFSLVAGAIFSYHGQVGFVIVGIIAYILIQKAVTRFVPNQTQALPYLVFAASLLSRLGIVFIGSGTISGYALMMAAVESGLSFILTMIFIQSVPLLTVKRVQRPLKNEEIICLIILLASVMTGTVGWAWNDVTVEHVLARYLLLIFGLVGGAAIGSTVGVVTGLILSLASLASLYQMSLLAFSGLLGGLLKEGKKVGVAVGLLVGTLLIGMYGEGGPGISATVIETLVAISLFFLTPNRVIHNIARYIPGTVEYATEQQQYLRKIRDVTAGRVEQFSTLFQTLSKSFQMPAPKEDMERDEKEVDYFLSNVTEKTCQTCFKKERCWVQNFSKTYDSMNKIMTETAKNGEIKDQLLQLEWNKHCIRPEKVVQAIVIEHSHYQVNQMLRKQVSESRKLVADQLLGVSQVMGDFAKEIQKEKEAHFQQEEELMEMLRGAGMEVGHLDIYSLKPGQAEIELSVPYDNGQGIGEKIIAPMLSSLLNENVVMQKEELHFYSNGHSHMTFGSAKQFVIETGVANVAKGGAWISGDSYSTLELGSGQYAIAISDGMGNGERAHLESTETLQLLQKVLESGIEEMVAIKSVNSVLSLRTTDEIFSTLDLAMIDLQTAKAKFLKIGSIPTFIKRGDKVIKIDASNLPMGMFQDFDVDVVSEQLMAGDILVMVSDGIFDSPSHVENKDLWMKRLIAEMEVAEPQEMADIILERVIRSDRGILIEDDMTVIVAQIKRNTPKWASIPIYRTPMPLKKRA
ncbi:stage II sporulation protein E [Alkalicoccobacillus murimartini]|uniref:Stage II sporulation protein E n=1 Tax=Alkalicoccobacillus murimartini TaxID=171685 RepID=A0ABT9YQB7_9BACI|nr:stage II sporulation protein E [Alkalicoccobacillus murimartini]MDQ0209219.1 stage II sporulation protein E [Alkalicoccobacillus murimartini]